MDILSDKALVGFLKVIVEINRDVQLLAYRNDERLSTSSGKNFQLRMGFGLHAGWAIEGAVGSLQKVDATYLSPHVNMAARMDAATRQFGVSILVTNSFFKVSQLRASLGVLLVLLELCLILSLPSFVDSSFRSQPKAIYER